MVLGTLQVLKITEFSLSQKEILLKKIRSQDIKKQSKPGLHGAQKLAFSSNHLRSVFFLAGAR